jgi:Uri superfamily endonuclease
VSDRAPAQPHRPRESAAGAPSSSERRTAATTAGSVARRPAERPRLYIVLTRVPRRAALAVGSLGTVTLPRGWYAYVGSAARAREARVARHLTREKPLRWHADYLFTAFPAERAWLVDGAAGECELAAALAALPGAVRLPRRFGASDCRCAGHLVRFARRPLRRDLTAAAHTAGAPAQGAVRSFALRPPHLS